MTIPARGNTGENDAGNLLQMLTAEECSTGREGTRLEEGSSTWRKDRQYFLTSDISGGFNALQLLEVCVWIVVTKGNMEV